MGGERQGEVRRRTDHLPVRCDRRPHLPAPVLCEKCQNGSDRGRKEGIAANRGSSERSAIEMLKKVPAKKTTFGADLIEGMKLVLAHQRGKIELEQVWPKPVDVKAIRKRVKMSQAEFSRAYGISKRALQEWEQGGRQPDSAARAYLTVIAKEPAVVRRVLASE